MEIRKSDIESLRTMVEVEKGKTEQELKLGWEWKEVRTYPAIINKLLMAGYVECVYSSNRYKNYRVTEKGIAFIKESIANAAAEKIENQPTAKEELLIDPNDLFNEIIGYQDLKDLIRNVMLLDEPVHVLMSGPPSIAKSMFLIDIENAAGSQALPLLGSSTSQAGMWDMIAEKRPKFILIDEIEKMSPKDMAGLLSLLEHGRIIRTKVGRMMDVHVDVRVFAAANRIYKLPKELLSRFWRQELYEYTNSEYIQVVENVLVNREGISIDDAKKIASGLVGHTQDVRDAIRVARLSRRMGVDKALRLRIK